VNNSEYFFTGYLNDDCSDITFEYQHLFKRTLSHLKGKRLDITIKESKIKRSLAQNRWLWGVCHKTVINFIKESQGDVYDAETIHDFTIQHILNDNNSGLVISLDFNEFEALLNRLWEMAHKYPKEEVTKKIIEKLTPYFSSMMIQNVLEKRVLVNKNYKTTSQLTIKEFNEMKEKIQKFWAERGCIIPDPDERGNIKIDNTIKDE
jgi:hypothetical protein